MSPVPFITALLLPAASLTALAGDPGDVPAPESSQAVAVDWLTGENVSLGGILFPHIHFSSVYGKTSSGLGHELGAGHHDPVEDGWTVQGFELGMSARVNEHLEGYATWHGFWENESPNDFDSEFEEYFLKVKDLPGGFEGRGGRYLNRFGLHNSTHLHGWNWADNYLVNGRFFGDDGQYTIGGELTWNLPLPWTSALSVSIGDAQAEEHGHEDDEEDEDEHEEPLIEGAGAVFSDILITANWTNVWNANDFHQWRYGISGAWGDNAWGRSTGVYGMHGQYEWRENGFEPGGDYFRWRTEAMLREVDALTGHLPGEDDDEHGGEDDHGESGSGSFSEWGLYTSAAYGKALGRGVLEGALRYEYVEGVDEAGLPRRHRFGPGVTWYFNFLHTGFIRGQVNFDDIEGDGSEHSIWLSAGFNWGGAEVR